MLTAFILASRINMLARLCVLADAGTWNAGSEVAAKFMVSEQLDANSAYLEAIVSKILAHPNVLQTFDFKVRNVFFRDALTAHPGSRALAAGRRVLKPAGMVLDAGCMKADHTPHASEMLSCPD